MVARVPVAVMLLASLLLLDRPADAAHAGWRVPLSEVRVGAPFRFDPARPFERGARRGAVLTGTPGEPVRAVCAGRVTFAGRHPRLGPGVTLACGPLVATELGLGRVRVGRGARVRRGARLGTLGAHGRLHLGARRAGRRHGYRDPLALLERPGAPPALGPAPRPRRAAPPRPGARPAPLDRRRAVAEARDPAAPWPAWAAVAVLGAAAGGTTAVRRRRRARATARRGAAVADR